MSRIFLLFVLSFSSVISASELPFTACETLLIYEKNFTRLRNTNTQVPTVRIVGRTMGAHGGERIVLERIGEANSWYSRYKIDLNGPQGDPRSLVTVLGPALAYFFGVREVPGDRVTIPDSDELNGAIKKLNKALVHLGYSPIPIYYYRQGASDNGSLRYMRELVRYGLPYADYEDLQIHDAAYHLAALILTGEVLAPVIDRYRWAMQFYDHIHTLRAPILAQQINRGAYLDILVAHADRGLGNLQRFFNARFAESESFKTDVPAKEVLSMLETPWEILTYNGTSMRQMVRYVLTGMLKEASGTEAQRRQWMEILETFSRRHADSASDVDKPYVYTPIDIYLKMMKRKSEMQQALNWLQSK